jgi:hypothetical protein
MTDALSSNSMVQAIKARHAGDLAMLEKAPERCTDEGWNDVRDFADLFDEIEQLERIRANYQTVCEEKDREIERLRAALQEIAEAWCGGMSDLANASMLQRIAREALRAAQPDETLTSELLDVHAICDQRDKFRNRCQQAEELIRDAPIHHFGKDYERWIARRETFFNCPHPAEWQTQGKCGLCLEAVQPSETTGAR